MQVVGAVADKGKSLESDAAMMEEYASHSKLLREFTDIPSIDKAWTFKSECGKGCWAMFNVGQTNLKDNKKRTLILSSRISITGDSSVDFQWSPFPVEMTDVSAVVPAPSGSKLLVVRNKQNESTTQLEIWGPSKLEKEMHIPQSVHGSLYTDAWFEGISWNHKENLIAYVAEEASPSKPTFNYSGFQKEGFSDKDCGSWKGQGDWEETWGETYSKKRKPSLFVVNIESGEVRAVEGISEHLNPGQVIWAPSVDGCHDFLVFVAWSSDNGPKKTSRKLGIKYCYNRPCALYAIRAPFEESSGVEISSSPNEIEGPAAAIELTKGITSAFFPQFCPDGKSLVFLSAKSAVDSGVHWATNSLHKMDWPTDGRPCSSLNVTDVVPIVMCPDDGCFPGLYCSSFISHPWLSDGCTMILSSVWYSTQVILAVNISSCEVLRISPNNSSYSWNVLALDGDNILAVSSSPIDPPQIKYGYRIDKTYKSAPWNWIDVSSPLSDNSDKVRSLLSEYNFSIMKIPVKNASENLSEGAKKPFEAIFVSISTSLSEESCEDKCKDGAPNPLILVLHGGPHSVSLSGFSKSVAYLSSLGYNLLIVNYRGSLGFGEDALQSLPGKIGSQDVNDVLVALDYVIEKGLADPHKVAVLGGSHGGFLATHLIGQAPDRFSVAAARNPVCNLALMAGTTDIPDWCYVEACGQEAKDIFSEAPSPDYLTLFYNKSPISHLSKVERKFVVTAPFHLACNHCSLQQQRSLLLHPDLKVGVESVGHRSNGEVQVKAPILFLLGAQDLRVPVSNGLQYARALKEKGSTVKIMVFPEDIHGLERPQTDYESFINIGMWFNKYCK